MKTRTLVKKGMVQRQFVLARQVFDDLLRVASPHDSSRYAYLMILEIEGISYALKSEDEQAALNAQYQELLAGLDYPVTIVWQCFPLDTAPHREKYCLNMEDLSQDRSDALPLLAQTYDTFFEQLGEQRPLFRRTMFIQVRFSPPSLVPQSSLWQRVKRLFWRKRESQDLLAEIAQVREVLSRREEELNRLFGNLHLTVKRLKRRELIRHYHACFQPYAALLSPLPEAVIDGLECPVQSGPSRHLVERVSSENFHGPVTDDTNCQQEQTDLPAFSFAQMADLVSPTAVVTLPDHIEIGGEEYVRVLVVQNLPRMVSLNWLSPLASLDEATSVYFHLHPCHSADMLAMFVRRHQSYQASQLAAAQRGRTLGPENQIAEADLDEAIMGLASGEERLLLVGFLVAVHAQTKAELDERTERVRAVLRQMLVVARVARFEQDRAWRSCLPHASNEMADRIPLTSQAASTMFPFVSNSLYHPDGILEGVTPRGDLVVLDPWHQALANANRVVLSPPGYGKSHYVKSGLIRSWLKDACAAQQRGTADLRSQWIVIDPEREYGRLASVLGGQVVRLSPGSAHCLNPFDLPLLSVQQEESDPLADHIQRLHGLFAIMLADHGPDGASRLTAQEKGLLDTALVETYRKVGIHAEDRRTYDRPAPLLRDLYEVLSTGSVGPDTTGLAQRMRRYVRVSLPNGQLVKGSLAGLFSGPTNVALDRSVVVFDLRDLEHDLRPIGLFLVSNFVWTRAFQSHIPRQLVIDEVATLQQYESGAQFLEDMVRRARKHYLGVTLISQHPDVFERLSSYCDSKVLLHQNTTTSAQVAALFKLSEPERTLVERLGIGEALLLTNEKRIQMRLVTSTLEHCLITTNPRELAQQDPQAMLRFWHWLRPHRSIPQAEYQHAVRLLASPTPLGTTQTFPLLPALEVDEPALEPDKAID